MGEFGDFKTGVRDRGAAQRAVARLSTVNQYYAIHTVKGARPTGLARNDAHEKQALGKGRERSYRSDLVGRELEMPLDRPFEPNLQRHHPPPGDVARSRLLARGWMVHRSWCGRRRRTRSSPASAVATRPEGRTASRPVTSGRSDDELWVALVEKIRRGFPLEEAHAKRPEAEWLADPGEGGRQGARGYGGHTFAVKSSRELRECGCGASSRHAAHARPGERGPLPIGRERPGASPCARWSAGWPSARDAPPPASGAATQHARGGGAAGAALGTRVTLRAGRGGRWLTTARRTQTAVRGLLRRAADHKGVYFGEPHGGRPGRRGRGLMR